MSHITPAEIIGTLSGFDAYIRGAVDSGNLAVVEKKEKEIKFFYKLCMRLTDPDQVAAFNRNFFLHGFMRDYRKKKESSTFIEDQRERMRKYDNKVWANSLVRAKTTPVVDPASNLPAISLAKSPAELVTHPKSLPPTSLPKLSSVSAAQMSGPQQSAVLSKASAPQSLAASPHKTPAPHTDITPSSLRVTSPSPFLKTTSSIPGSKAVGSSVTAFGSPSAGSIPRPKLPTRIDQSRSLPKAKFDNAVDSLSGRQSLPKQQSRAVPNPELPQPAAGGPAPTRIDQSRSLPKAKFDSAVASLRGEQSLSKQQSRAVPNPKLQEPAAGGPGLTRTDKSSVPKAKFDSAVASLRGDQSLSGKQSRPVQQSRGDPKPKLQQPAAGGPGPRTLANSVARLKGNDRRPNDGGIIRRSNPFEHGTIRRPIGDDDLDLLEKIDEEDVLWRTFQEIEDEGSQSDYEPSRDFSNANAGNGKRKRDISEDDEDRTSAADDEPRTKGKGKGKQVHYVDEIEEPDDVGKSIRYRPRISSTPAEDQKLIVTGRYHPQKCSHCRLSERLCEIQVKGGACVSCRKFKHKCEYSRARKELKSKPFVESEDGSSGSETPQPTGTPQPRHPRLAAAAARRAIKKVVAIEKPPAKKVRTKEVTISQQPVTSPAAVFNEEVMTKIDAILNHLSDMSGYLKRIVEVGEGSYEMGEETFETSDANLPVVEGSYEMGEGSFEVSHPDHDVEEKNSTPPLSASSPRESLSRLSSPLSSPSPSPNLVESNRRRDSIVPVSSVIPTGLSAGLSAVPTEVVDPLPASPQRSHVTPNVNLIQPTPDNSQNGVPFTQLHPTPHRPVPGSTTDVSPAVVSEDTSITQLYPTPHLQVPIPTTDVAPAVAPAVSLFSPLNASSSLIPPVNPVPADPSPTLALTRPTSPATALFSPSSPMTSAVPLETHLLAEKSGLVTSLAVLIDHNDTSSGELPADNISDPPPESQDQISQTIAPLRHDSDVEVSDFVGGPEIYPAAAPLSMDDILSMPETIDLQNKKLTVPPLPSSGPATRNRSRSTTPTPMSPGPAGRTRSRSRTPLSQGMTGTLTIPDVRPSKSRSVTPSRAISPLSQSKKRKSDAAEEDDGTPRKKSKL